MISAARLAAARHEGDAPADAVIAALGAGAWAVNGLLRGVRRNRDPLPAALPPSVAQLLAETAAPPAWLDGDRVARAERWAHAHAAHLAAALFCASLPTAYAAARGARVLVATGRMTGGDLDRRVNETARFVFDVCGPGGFGPEGAALRSIQKVRLVHACVRACVPVTDEVAINQEDLLGTLLTFSIVVVRAVRRLGVRVADRDAEDYFHLWRGAGALMGIVPALLPEDVAAAERAAALIGQRQFHPSAEGRALMAQLLARIEAHARLPGLGAAPRWLVRHLVGDRLADLLGVPRPHGPSAALGRLAAASPLARVSASALANRVAPHVARPLLEAIIALKLGGATPAFALPVELRANA